MKSIFLQTAEHSIANANHPICLTDLPKLIRKHTYWNYSCVPTATGCLLKPKSCDMPYRNTFVPEIEIVVTSNDGQTILYMRGRPLLYARIFMAIWFGALLLAAFLIPNSITSVADGLSKYTMILSMGAIGYLFGNICTKVTFKSVVKAIKKELK